MVATITKNGTAEAVTDETPKVVVPMSPIEQRLKDDREFLLHLSLPEWTEEHYTLYTNAQAAARNAGVDMVLAQYYGVLALFKGQHVRVVDLPKLQELLSRPDAEQKYVPLAVKGAMIRAVAMPLEAAVNLPFLAYLTE